MSVALPFAPQPVCRSTGAVHRTALRAFACHPATPGISRLAGGGPDDGFAARSAVSPVPEPAAWRPLLRGFTQLRVGSRRHTAGTSAVRRAEG